MEIDCSNCKTGQLHRTNMNARDNSTMTLRQFIAAEKVLGNKCLMCEHNGIGRRKSKLYKKINASFQSIDLFEPIEGY